MLDKNLPLWLGDVLESVEVVDQENRPLCVLSLFEARRQSLCHRTVLVLIFISGNKVYLEKRDSKERLYPGRLDLSIRGHVRTGESSEGAAVRALREKLGLYAEGVDALMEVSAGPETGPGFVTLFSVDFRGRGISPDAWGEDVGFFVDKAELDYLAENFRDMLTPSLVYFWEKNLIFPSLGL